MWFARRKLSNKAVAYLKEAAPSDDPAPPLGLSHEDSPVLKNLGNGLLAAYVVDNGTSFQYIQWRDIDRDQVTPDELHKIAVDNLNNLASKQMRVQHGNGIFAVFLDGNFEASLILVDELWNNRFRSLVSGQYAVAIPARDILAFGDISYEEALNELRAVIERLRGRADHPISNDIFVRTNDVWQKEPT